MTFPSSSFLTELSRTLILMTAIRIRSALLAFGMLAFIVFVPAHVSFAYSTAGSYGYGYPSYQLYWCNGYYSYSPCTQQYYYYPQSTQYTYPSYYSYYSYTPYQYYYPSYYGYYGYNSGYSYMYNGNYNYNYNYNGF